MLWQELQEVSLICVHHAGSAEGGNIEEHSPTACPKLSFSFQASSATIPGVSDLDAGRG